MTERTPLHGTDLEPKPTTLVNVRYLGQRDERCYAYILPDFLTVEKGDLVIVQARDTHALAKIVNFNGSPEYATKYVVDKVDFTKFNEWYAEVVPF